MLILNRSSHNALSTLLLMQAFVMLWSIAQQGATCPDIKGTRQVAYKVVERKPPCLCNSEGCTEQIILL